MKKYKYVVVVGCSFSVDPPHDKSIKEGKSYGRLIAEHFGSKYYDLADCGYSIQGMHRRILEWCSKNKDKFKDTLVIVGKTSVRRIEIWNNKSNDWLNETVVAFTYPWNNDILVVDWPEEERKNYLINFYNGYAEFFRATQNIIGLQTFFKVNNIDHVFFDALESMDNFWARNYRREEDKFGYKLLFDNLVSKENWYTHPEYKFMQNFLNKNPEMRLSEEDGHPNKEGHKRWSECLIEYINENV